MHMIQAIVKPSAVERVMAQLTSLGVLGCTAIEVKGFGKQKGHTERYRGGRMDVGFVPKVMLEVAVKNDDLQRTIDAIRNSANTGKVGDGKIFVMDLQKVIRIRTGETDDDAL